MHPDDTVSLAIQEHVHDDDVHECFSGHVVVRTDVQFSGQLVDDSDISVIRIAHEMDRHGANKICNLPAGCQHFRILIKCRIPRAAERAVFVAGQNADNITD